MYLGRQTINYGIDMKPDIEQLICSSAAVPVRELHVESRTQYSDAIVQGPISLALVANPAIPGYRGYTIGFIEGLSVVPAAGLWTPLVINHGMIDREMKEFRDNAFYGSYDLVIISPSVDLFSFLGTKNAMAPYATPDRM